MSDVLYSDMNITVEEERTGLRHLFGIGFELPVPPEQTRKLAGYIARKMSDYDALAAQHAQELSELAASKHLFAELTDRKNDLEARLSNLSNDATADQKAFAHIHKILDEAQVPQSQKIEGQKHSVWLTAPRRVEWLVENIAARSMHLNEAVQDAVARNIDLIKYNGKTIREWIVLSNTLQQQLAQSDILLHEKEQP